MKLIFAIGLAFALVPIRRAQDNSQNPTASSTQESGTSTDLYVMLGSDRIGSDRIGSDLVRPGLAARANYNLGIGHTFGFLNKRVGGYAWVQVGITSLTGNAHVQNRFYNGESLGWVVHFSDRHSIWIRETFNKIATVPW